MLCRSFGCHSKQFVPPEFVFAVSTCSIQPWLWECVPGRHWENLLLVFALFLHVLLQLWFAFFVWQIHFAFWICNKMRKFYKILATDLQNICKRFAKYLQKICKIFAKDLQNICKTSKNDGTNQKNGIFANILQKNANSTCKMNPPYQKKCEWNMQIYRKKNAKIIHFQHPSLYQTNSHKIMGICCKKPGSEKAGSDKTSIRLQMARYG